VAAFVYWPSDPLPKGVTADRVIVEKSARRLVLIDEGTEIKSYRVSLGFAPSEPKTQEGDGRTPEGLYSIDWRNPQSGYHLSLHISYPDATDLRNARQRGVSPGGDIMIHGLPNGKGWIGRFHWLIDWTNGCIAVTNEEIEEIWRSVPNGTMIEILP
jgi:murein L,D-transpeptidase YafK